MSFRSTLCLAAISISTCQLAFSDSLYDFSSVNQTFSDNPVTLGFAFSVTSPFQVTSLGWFSPTADGLQTEHNLAIYDSAGTLVTSTSLPIGTNTVVDGFFRYQSITPVTLNAGSQYVLAGTSGGSADAWTVNDLVSGFTINPAFTIGPEAALFTYSESLVNPTSHFSDYLVYAGPNLVGHEVESVAPEPTSVLLVATAGAALFLLRRLRSVAQNA